MNLVLFFTRGNSLKTWDDVGMFDREVALYRRLQENGYTISFVTYGGPSEFAYESRIPGINILCNKWHLPTFLYQRLIPYLHASVLRQADLIKTNQMNGAEVALYAARKWKKPLIARCGFMWSVHAYERTGAQSAETLRARKIEERVFRAAKKIVVTAPLMADDIAERIPEAKSKTTIIPNYVETDRFMPLDNVEKVYDVLFLGRFTLQKNIKALLEAVKALEINIALIGEGDLKKGYQKEYASLNNQIDWVGRVPNRDLPFIMNKARIFILPSFYEGHPKVLLEAMSCGLPVIGANSPGIREVISHGENGWLCETDSESIKTAIHHLLTNPDLCKRLGANARTYALENISLDRILEKEMDVHRSIMGS